jgi:TonB-dependent SusC/RagA subfamily outer membrane receptor
MMSTTRRTLITLAGAGVLLGASACSNRAGSAPRPAGDSVQVGYGAQPKDKVTGSVTTLSDNDISSRPQRIEELLRGKVPGLIILGSGPDLRLRLRGTNSMSIEQDALVIVDDVMIQSGNIANALAGLSPDDIKQVSVLKDVASTSIYGMRGAGGVIIIKTKNKPDSEERGR